MTTKNALAAVLFAPLLAAAAAAAPFEEQVADAAARIRAGFDALRSAPPASSAPALPAGTRRSEARAFQDGWDAAERALARPRCEGYFAEKGAPAPRPLETMRAAEYRFVALPQGPSVGAQTNSAGSVYLNSAGLFVTAAGGGIELDGRSYDLGDVSAVRAMILLHELGHQLGIFGPDSGPALAGENAAHSRDIVERCLDGRLL